MVEIRDAYRRTVDRKNKCSTLNTLLKAQYRAERLERLTKYDILWTKAQQLISQPYRIY